MNIKHLQNKIVLAVFSITIAGTAQEIGTEVINVVKPYTPTVADAEKIKETPQIGDTIPQSQKEVTYSISSVPVASTFTPDKGKASTVERKKSEKIYDNYATLGIGNYTSILAEFYSNFAVSRTDNFDLFLRHNSAQGGIDEVRLDDKFYDTNLDVNYSSRQRDMSYRLGFGVLHKMHNWYGLPDTAFTDEEINQIDSGHSFFGVGANGNLKFDDLIFSGGDASLRYFGDSFGSSEIQAVIQPEFEFELNGFDVGIKGDIDYLSGKFDRTYFDENTDISYGIFKLGAQPYIKLLGDDYAVNLGAKLVYGIDSENSDSDIFIYPKVSASYNLVEDFATIYAGADGDLDQNSYLNFAQENPFVSPTLFVVPTNRMYEAFAGLKGKFTDNISYNLKASYKSEEAKPLFIGNSFSGNFIDSEGYQYGNSFGVLYDDVNTLDVFAELQADITKDFSLGVNANFYSYSTDILEEAYNLPTIKASVFANGSFSEKFYGGINLFYVGERKDINMEINPWDGFQEVTLDGYFDVNLHLGYRITNQLSVFVKGNNLLGDNYEKWQNTPVLGLQVMGGITYKFDW